MDLTLKQLYAFRAVAEFGSFTRAAERLGTVQPILSTQVRALERELGVTLFDRTTRRVELTEAGREFLRRIDDLVDGLEQAVHGVRDLAQRRQGRLTVAAPPLLASVLVPAAIMAFRQEHPDVVLALIDRPTKSILEAIRSGEADLGIGTFPAHVTDVGRTVLVRDDLVLYRRAPPSGLGGAPEPVAWRDLAGEDLITLTPGSGIRTLVDHGLRTAGVLREPIFEVDQVATALALVGAGVGVAVLPAYAGGHRSAVVAHPLREPKLSREMSVITARGRQLSPMAQFFSTILRRLALPLAKGASTEA